jgi:hypothetical protein
MGLSRDKIAAAIDEKERGEREESATRRLLKQSQAKVSELEAKVDALTAIDSLNAVPSPFAAVPKSSSGHRGTVSLMLSDAHWDEVIRQEQINYPNSYNREIATIRLHATVKRTITIARDYINGITYDGLILWLGGDLVSGNIHDELSRTNDGQHMLDTIDFWSDQLATVICGLADHFGKVHVPVVVGNHGRTSRKPEAKNAVRSNYDWLLARIVQRALKSDERITWNISEARALYETVYDHRYRFEHGDQFKGGEQITGPVRPVMYGRQQLLNGGAQFDTLLVCDKHQYSSLPGATVNGSLCGYGEFADGRHYRPEPPQLAFWVNTPENGPSFHLPVLPADRAAEGW